MERSAAPSTVPNEDHDSLPASTAREYVRKRSTSNGTSSAFSSTANPDEDWTKISDLAERRRIQNRIAQRNYRKKLKKRLEELERRAGSHSAEPPMQAMPDNGSIRLPDDSNDRTRSPLLIAIDYGTTYTGIAYANSNYENVHNRSSSLSSWSWGTNSDMNDSNPGLYQPTYSVPAYIRSVIAGEHKFEWAPRAPFWKRAYMKATDYKRKAVQVVLNGKSYFARPDSGSDKNIMTEAFARDCGAHIYRGEDDRGLFQMGTGQCIQSIGRAFVPLKLLADGESEGYSWFHIIPKCPVPLIIGAEFLRKIQLFTKNKHLLVECPFSFGSIPTLKWIGSPQGKLCFFASGQLLTGCADTGSDLDLMSLDCAEAYGFKIDKRHCSRTRVMLADESIVETVGQVHISSVQLPGCCNDFNMSFHVLPNLVSDVIFGEEFLEQMDAFSTCNIVDSTDPFSPYSLNPFINLGPLQSFLSRRSTSKKGDSSTMLQQHDSEIEAEIYRRNKVNRTILKMTDEYRIDDAKMVEETRRRAFNLKHVRCVHCSGIPEPPDHQSKAIGGSGPVSVRVIS